MSKKPLNNISVDNFAQKAGPLSASNNLNLFNETSRYLTVGLIVDVVSYHHDYEVKVSTGTSIKCSYINPGNHTPLGPKDHTLLTPGQFVLIVRPNNIATGYIIGCLPQEVGSLLFNKPNWLLLNSGVSLLESQAHLSSLSVDSNIRSVNESRPRDTVVGDSGQMGLLGVGYNISLLSAILRASELCGVELYYLNNLFRLSAHNYQFWNALKETYMGESNSESYLVERLSPYPFEMSGMPVFGEFVNTDNKDQKIQDNGVDPLWKRDQTKARLEPLRENPVAIPRITRLGGYIGDLEREIISCPNSSQIEQEGLEDKTDYNGLAEITKHINGLLEFRSSKEIRLTKDVYIATPKQIAELDSTQTETQEDYKFSGIHGKGEEHNKKEFESSEDGRLTFASLLDELAWSRYKYGWSNVINRPKTWYLSKEENTDLYSNTSIDYSKIISTGKSFLADPFKVVSLTIDHRENHTAKYTKARSTVVLKDNGDIYLENGYGSSISLINQNIEISCAGDFIVKTGRSTHVLSPNDINLRAGNNADISADSGDIRIAANKNLHTVSGVSGQGGTLIESKAKAPSQTFKDRKGTDIQSAGVNIVSRNSDLNIFSDSIYVKSSKELDLNVEQGQFNLVCNNKNEYINNGCLSIYGTTPNNPRSIDSYEYSNGTSKIMRFSTTGLYSDVSVDGNLTATRQVAGRTGAFESVSEGPFRGNALERITSSNSEFLNDIKDTSESFSASSSFYREESSLADLEESIGFTFRTSDQYNLDLGANPLFYESRWQYFYRKNNVAEKWPEMVISSPDDPGSPTMAFPGYENWTDASLFATVNYSFWNEESGDNIDLSEFEEGKPQVALNSIKDGYLINYSGQ